jgi:hypothetical protein
MSISARKSTIWPDYSPNRQDYPSQRQEYGKRVVPTGWPLTEFITKVVASVQSTDLFTVSNRITTSFVEYT